MELRYPRVKPVTRAQPSPAKAIAQRDALRAMFPDAHYEVRDRHKLYYVVAIIEAPKPDYGTPRGHLGQLFRGYDPQPLDLAEEDPE